MATFGALGLAPYLQGGRNLMDLANVSRGEEVLLLVTPETDPRVAELIAVCAGMRDATVTTLYQQRARGHERVSSVLGKAMQGAGCVFDLGEPFVLHSTEGVVALLDWGMKYFVVPSSLEKFGTPAARRCGATWPIPPGARFTWTGGTTMAGWTLRLGSRSRTAG